MLFRSATNYTLNVRRDYTWEPFATGQLTSFFMDGERELQRGQEDENAYKLKDLYATGYDFVFVLKDGVMTMFESQNAYGYVFVTGFVHSNPAYGMVSINFDSDPEYSTFSLEDKKIVL